MDSHVMRSKGRAFRLLFIALLALVLLIGFSSASSLVTAAPPGGSGIVSSVVKAPIVPDGNVTGALTDIVITLEGSLDPSVEGRTLPAGKQIKITLPDAFISKGLPGGTILTPVCAGPFPFQCNTGILLQGWPQHPIFPMFPPGMGDPEFYTVGLEGTHTLVFTALEDVGPGLDFPGPGIKQIHLFALGFQNPRPGFYDIEVMAETGPGGAQEFGTGRIHIVPRARPNINVASVFNGGINPNTIYQQAGTNQTVPLPYDFLLWDRHAEPFTGVDIEMVNRKHALMKQGNAVVGHVFIDAPKKAKGQEVSAVEPSFQINAPNSGIPTARLTANFKTGDKPGNYAVTFSLIGGNSATMYVHVE